MDQVDWWTIEAEPFEPSEYTQKKADINTSHWGANGAWSPTALLGSESKTGKMRGNEEVGSVTRLPPSPPTLCISEIGLSLPERCLFVLPRRGLKKERMQAARVERQGQAEWEKNHDRGWRVEGDVWAFPGIGPPASPPLLGDYAGTQSWARRRAGALGEPCIKRVSTVESGAGVCARGLPHTVPPPQNLLPWPLVSRDTSISPPCPPSAHFTCLPYNR